MTPTSNTIFSLVCEKPQNNGFRQLMEKRSLDSEKVNRGGGNHIAFGETRFLTAIQGTRINLRFDLSIETDAI
jgi:hypothetical protein